MSASNNISLGSYGSEIVRDILVSRDPIESKRLFKKLRELETQNNKL